MRSFEATPGPAGPVERMDDDEARWVVLETVFEGDAHAWIDYLLTHGSPRQMDQDLPFAIRMALRGADGPV